MVPQVKSLSKILFALYLLMLLWLVLFKFSFNFSAVLAYQSRSLNLIPFAGSSRDDMNEMIYNVVVFIPFGLLLSVNLKQTNFWRKLACVFIFSLAAEIIQFVLAIGVTDITDVITNTFGGFLGLILYDLSNKYVANKKLDLFDLTLPNSKINAHTSIVYCKFATTGGDKDRGVIPDYYLIPNIFQETDKKASWEVLYGLIDKINKKS